MLYVLPEHFNEGVGMSSRRSRFSIIVLFCVSSLHAVFSAATFAQEQAQKQAEFQQLFDGKTLEGWQGNMDPVSYTHLTLPTIYSV